MLVDIIKVFIL